MSYIVTVKRVIELSEVIDLLKNDRSLVVTRQDSQTVDLLWTDGEEQCDFQLVRGEIQATTPSSAAARKLTSLAKSLGATVVGEEDLIPTQASFSSPGVFNGRNTWVGWPVLVIVLLSLLIWRW